MYVVHISSDIPIVSEYVMCLLAIFNQYCHLLDLIWESPLVIVPLKEEGNELQLQQEGNELQYSDSHCTILCNNCYSMVAISH